MLFRSPTREARHYRAKFVSFTRQLSKNETLTNGRMLVKVRPICIVGIYKVKGGGHGTHQQERTVWDDYRLLRGWDCRSPSELSFRTSKNNGMPYEGSGQIRAKIYAKALRILPQRDESKIRRVFHNELTSHLPSARALLRSAPGLLLGYTLSTNPL